ncbi:two-component system sensor histidine kinase NarX [Yersinia ruckeri]|uniref:nitrate/nitrite two-component system sensor histidine kinase NarX n=1 Tax=Yersinia ruckeri TaxID=29486 RepID=UPI0008FD0B33|nr:nitrate/nitrite two-component system sensor histidine kinase NarX [Yersinia ruckeri]MCW6522054.1 nitrate/nitrite two-component system sensor histidine kinase NarX [Yersinia ruckeri]MCW6602519.1 nitrate/nitrite two-component system sensor histidine kinase NarX [Yersinia ruckeri]MDN0090587.1 nitrate/nitrite two-component system sensor histidine kinase NarX [Yersinia ruckeri]OIX43437.1 two-component system sensor histidine kinase NarX [Yersinia ruckeri]OJB69808.1 two-component system sensor hi
MKRYLIPLVNQVALMMLLLSLLGLAGMSISSWMAHSIQGNAHAINKAGSLRMQSYRLLSMVPLKRDDLPYIDALERDKTSIDLQQSLQREGLTKPYLQLNQYWSQILKPDLQQAQCAEDVAPQVANFVHQLDALVLAIDHKTEQRIVRVSVIQWVFIALTLVLLLATTFYLRRRLLRPWLQLIAMANAIARGDFSRRYTLTHNRDEMGTLGMALNRMSQELSLIYTDLEQRVEEKTADLQQKNQVLAFLYRSSQELHTHQPLAQRLTPVIEQLQSLTPLKNIQICLYGSAGDSYHNPLNTAQSSIISSADLEHALTPSYQWESLSWSLSDKLEQYGLLLARQPVDQPLNTDQQQLIHMLVEQLTSTLALENQARHQQQLLLMNERSAIARELHDSIAQSLSCLKIQISCLQQHAKDLPEPSQVLMQQMREELNIAYRQLRELLTTFRLKLNEATLNAALEASAAEFSDRIGVPVTLDYQLPPELVPAHQAIHLVQVAREALNNIYKHAQCTQVSIQVFREQEKVVMVVQDNGLGIGDSSARPNHYGLMIMHDRAHSLGGQCEIRQRETGGTEVRIQFPPDNNNLD